MLSREVKKNVIARLYEERDAERALSMSAYMRNQFPFLGISNPIRRELTKDFLKQAKAEKEVDWDFILELWELEEREFQYVAADYLRTLQAFLTVEDMPHLRQLVVSKSWWDTVDSLDRTIGNIQFPNEELDNIMLEWSLDENIWLRRIAIDHQLLRKDKMKTALLEQILINNLHQTEFFINKAMGWILRDYSKTNPDWVRVFLKQYEEGLSPLTIREASKYL